MKKLILTAMAVVAMATGAVAEETDGLRGEQRLDVAAGKIKCSELAFVSAPMWQRILTLGIHSGVTHHSDNEYQLPGGLAGLIAMQERADEWSGAVAEIDKKLHQGATRAWGKCTDDLGVTAEFDYRRGEPSTLEIREIKK